MSLVVVGGEGGSHGLAVGQEEGSRAVAISSLRLQHPSSPTNAVFRRMLFIYSKDESSSLGLFIQLINVCLQTRTFLHPPAVREYLP